MRQMEAPDFTPAGASLSLVIETIPNGTPVPLS